MNGKTKRRPRAPLNWMPPPSPPEPTRSEQATRWLTTWRELGGSVAHPGGDVYFVQHETGGLIKIGVSTHVPTRLRDLNAMSHDPRYVVLAAMAGAGTLYERMFHDLFADIRMHGEWFRPESALLDFIEEVKRAQP